MELICNYKVCLVYFYFHKFKIADNGSKLKEDISAPDVETWIKLHKCPC